VLVAIERQHGEVGGLTDQDWSLRVTLVFQRKGRNGSWYTAMPTRWCTPSAWGRWQSSRAARADDAAAGVPALFTAVPAG
jgi:hypothetical protein